MIDASLSLQLSLLPDSLVLIGIGVAALALAMVLRTGAASRRIASRRAARTSSSVLGSALEPSMQEDRA